MGVIWLQTTTGQLIHLPIVEEDFNTPNSPVKIPVDSFNVGAANRCLSGTFTVNNPTYGSVTFDFGAPGRTGSCNQCGQCCSHPIASCTALGGNCGYVVDTGKGVHKCRYLTILPGAQKGIGKTNGTECSIRPTLDKSVIAKGGDDIKPSVAMGGGIDGDHT